MGVFISCAMPAASRPTDSSFASKARAYTSSRPTNSDRNSARPSSASRPRVPGRILTIYHVPVRAALTVDHWHRRPQTLSEVIGTLLVVTKCADPLPQDLAAG